MEFTMMQQSLTQPQQSGASALPGAWKLGAGRAITLQPRESGELRIAHGRMWATFDGTHPGPLNETGDMVLETGDSVHIEAGQRLVVDAWTGGSSSYFSWEPEPVPQAAMADAVVQPLADLRLALTLGGKAVVQLALALAN